MKRNILVSTTAKRYAKAVLEVAIKQHRFSEVLEELERFADHLETVSLLRSLFLNPAVPWETKRNVLAELAKKLDFQQITLNFLNTLIHRGRLKLLDQVIVSAEQQFLERQGIVVAQAITAQKLDPEEEKQLVLKLESFTGKKIQLENKIDPALVGGVITKIGTTLYDGSVVSQLDQLRARIEEA